MLLLFSEFKNLIQSQFSIDFHSNTILQELDSDRKIIEKIIKDKEQNLELLDQNRKYLFSKQQIQDPPHEEIQLEEEKSHSPINELNEHNQYQIEPSPQLVPVKDDQILQKEEFFDLKADDKLNELYENDKLEDEIIYSINMQYISNTNADDQPPYRKKIKTNINQNKKSTNGHLLEMINLYPNGKKNGLQQVNQGQSLKNNGLISQKFNSKYPLKKGSTYRKYSEKEKIEAISMVKSGYTIRHVSEVLSISAKNLKRWVQIGAKRIPGGGRKVLDPIMENQLFNWIKAFKEQGIKVTKKEIRNKAKKLSHYNDFKASKGWVEKFLKRFQLNKEDFLQYTPQGQYE